LTFSRKVNHRQRVVQGVPGGPQRDIDAAAGEKMVNSLDFQ
jgi:hypothetical protein